MDEPLAAQHQPTTAAKSDAGIYDAEASSGDDASQAETTPAATRKLGVLATACFVFVSSSAGPFGADASVATAGPLMTLIGMFLCPALIILPIILMMEELGSWMPTHHGSMRWVARGLGPTVGFFNAFFQQAMNLIDVSVYPVLASDYITSKLCPDIDFWPEYAIRLAIIVIFGIPNFFPMKDMGVVTGIITLIIIAPFIVGFFAGTHYIDPSAWGQVNSASNLKLSKMLSIALWMYTGFLSNSKKHSTLFIDRSEILS